MECPKISFDENKNPIIVGEFELKVEEGYVVHDPYDFTPKKKIFFAFNPELHQDLQLQQTDDLCEAYAEKLKQAFLKLLKS